MTTAGPGEDIVFLHLIKDYMKKLEGVEQRLAVSLDRDEIQTLGLKLRFYFNEIKHYQRQMGEVYNRIIEIQDKYGYCEYHAGEYSIQIELPDIRFKLFPSDLSEHRV